MFKLFFAKRGGARPDNHKRLGSLCLLLLFGGGGCHTVPPLPPVSLEDPGWSLRQGQAVWQRNRHAPELAGDVLLATRADGRALVQFSKPPFPLVVAQKTAESWEVRIPTQNQFYSGRGRAPARLIWLYLPSLLSGGEAPKGWSWQKQEGNHWHLENHSTGEVLDGYFTE